MKDLNLREMTGIRLLVLMGTFCVLLIITAVISSFFLESNLNRRISLLVASGIQCVLAFCLPAWLTARFSSDIPGHWLYMDKCPPVYFFLGVVIAYFLALPFLNWVVDWNQNIHFPAAMGNLEHTLRVWEEENGKVVNEILGGADLVVVFGAILIVGLLTGFSEELFFRGALQGIFLRGGVKSWVAVWMTALIFSSLHFQFFGFIPRLLMGAFFGYLLVWSKSIWLPAFAHAFNNTVVVITYSDSTSDSLSTFETIGVSTGFFPWLAFGSMIILGIYLYFFRASMIRFNSHG